MQKTFQLLRQTFESSTGKTPEYLAFHRTFKREFTALLKHPNFNCTDIEIGKPNHFDVSGFFRAPNGQLWYFRLEDLRWSKSELLIRTANSNRDFTGGRNQWIRLSDALNFPTELRRLIVS